MLLLPRLRARAVDVVVLVLRGRLALARQALQGQRRLPLRPYLLQQRLQRVNALSGLMFPASEEVVLSGFRQKRL